MNELPNDVFLNGVPHSVQTSELTKNAINPRNAFIDHEKNELDDISADFAKQAFDPVKALQIQPASSEAKQSELNYPTTKDSFVAHDSLSVPKTHLIGNIQKLSTDQSSESEMFYESLHKVEDRIQNLRKKHPSKNIQQIESHTLQDNQQRLGGIDRFDDNMQSLPQKTLSENRQLIHEKVVGDNFQKLAPTENRHDSILYKEKKNIQDNLQQVAKPQMPRGQGEMRGAALSENSADLNAHQSHNDSHLRAKSVLHTPSVEDELTARVRKMKADIGKVKQSLTEIEKDKPEAQ